MEKVRIPLILGTARKGRRSEAAAKFLFERLQAREDIETEFVDVREHMNIEYTAPPWSDDTDEGICAWREIARNADGFLFIVPEYNHGMPGEMKLLLDSAFWEHYAYKPAAICGVSNGIFGGARMIDVIKPNLVELKMVPIRSAVYITKVEEAFGEDGTPADPEGLSKRASGVFDELVWFARTLKAGREGGLPGEKE